MAQLTLPQVSQSQLPLTPATGILGLFPIDTSGAGTFLFFKYNVAEVVALPRVGVTYFVSLVPVRWSVGLVGRGYRQGVTAAQSQLELAETALARLARLPVLLAW